MRQEHIKAILEGIVPVVKDAIAAAQKPLLDRIDVLERRGIEKGEPGAAGIDGKDGASVSMDDVTPVLAEMVEKAVAALPPAPKGDRGEPGQKGEPGRDGRDASDIPMLKSFIGEEMRMQLGQALQSFAVNSPDDGRTLSFSFEVAGESVQREIRTSLVLDRGVWRSGPFARGDGVSFGGSFFIAQLDTEDKPETSGAWRLAVKRGRDGRDGKNGEQGPTGPKGDKGEIGPRGFPSA